jgi:hypothetical protein
MPFSQPVICAQEFNRRRFALRDGFVLMRNVTPFRALFSADISRERSINIAIAVYPEHVRRDGYMSINPIFDFEFHFSPSLSIIVLMLPLAPRLDAMCLNAR